MGRHPACVVAVGLTVLDELAALHAAGRWHGAVDARNILVDAHGSVSLRSFARRPRKAELSEAALRTADVRATGELLSRILLVEANGRLTGPDSALEAAAEGMARSVARKKVRAAHEASQARLALWEAAGRLASRQQQVVARRRWQSWSRPSSPARHVCGTGSRTGPARRHAAPPSRRWQPPLERRGWGPSRCFRSWRCPRCWPRCRPPPPAPGSRERMLGHSPSRQAGCRRPRSATTGSSLRRRFRLRPCLRPGSGLPALAMSGR